MNFLSFFSMDNGMANFRPLIIGQFQGSKALFLNRLIMADGGTSNPARLTNVKLIRYAG